MITDQQIRELLEQKLASNNCFIVDVKVAVGNKIIVLIDSDKGVSIDDCVAVSRHIEQNLDREQEDFELNVMSAGLSEPFKIVRQYIKNIGKEVELSTVENKKIKGTLLAANEEGVEIEVKSMEKVEGKKKKQLIVSIIKLTYNQIKTTKLILSF